MDFLVHGGVCRLRFAGAFHRLLPGLPGYNAAAAEDELLSDSGDAFRLHILLHQAHDVIGALQCAVFVRKDDVWERERDRFLRVLGRGAYIEIDFYRQGL